MIRDARAVFETGSMFAQLALNGGKSPPGGISKINGLSSDVGSEIQGYMRVHRVTPSLLSPSLLLSSSSRESSLLSSREPHMQAELTHAGSVVSNSNSLFVDAVDHGAAAFVLFAALSRPRLLLVNFESALLRQA